MAAPLSQTKYALLIEKGIISSTDTTQSLVPSELLRKSKLYKGERAHEVRSLINDLAKELITQMEADDGETEGGADQRRGAFDQVAAAVSGNAAAAPTAAAAAAPPPCTPTNAAVASVINAVRTRLLSLAPIQQSDQAVQRAIDSVLSPDNVTYWAQYLHGTPLLNSIGTYSTVDQVSRIAPPLITKAMNAWSNPSASAPVPAPSSERNVESPIPMPESAQSADPSAFSSRDSVPAASASAGAPNPSLYENFIQPYLATQDPDERDALVRRFFGSGVEGRPFQRFSDEYDDIVERLGRERRDAEAVVASIYKQVAHARMREPLATAAAAAATEAPKHVAAAAAAEPPKPADAASSSPWADVAGRAATMADKAYPAVQVAANMLADRRNPIPQARGLAQLARDFVVPNPPCIFLRNAIDAYYTNRAMLPSQLAELSEGSFGRWHEQFDRLVQYALQYTGGDEGRARSDLVEITKAWADIRRSQPKQR